MFYQLIVYIHSFFTYMNEGGFVMWPILIVSTIAWYLGALKFYDLHVFEIERKHIVTQLKSSLQYGTVPGFVKGKKSMFFYYLQKNLGTEECINKDLFKNVYREFLMDIAPKLDSNLSTIAAWISVAPLLGLLGTVAGMIETFRIITVFGAGNAGLTAEGISIALLTTQAGLTVAFPSVLMHNILNNRKTRSLNKLLKDGEDFVNCIKS